MKVELTFEIAPFGRGGRSVPDLRERFADVRGDAERIGPAAGLAQVLGLPAESRELDGGEATGAVTRVLLTATDGESDWTTIGVSANIIEASWDASMMFSLTPTVPYTSCVSRSRNWMVTRTRAAVASRGFVTRTL